jgi:antitoxin (DNA-binding transcriptional repressor) of toxin-antitoxin stability system
VERISVSKFKATCPEVLQRVNKTRKPVLVTRYDVPIAEVSPAPRQKRGSSWRGSMIGTGRMLGDIVSPASSEDDWFAATKGLNPP